MAALEYTNVVKQYRAVRALDDFTLAVEKGEIFGFLGPNGAGKSTAIHIALGLMRPNSGSGTMLGKPFGHAPTRRRVGFLAENVAFYHRPAARLVSFYGALNGMRGPELTRRTRELLDLVDLGQVGNKKVSKFSRGMLQRVGLAQALVNDPELLILDEPTSALDPAARKSVRELLLAARAQGKTIFLSSHLLSEVELICDRIAFLNKGRLVRLGRTSELLESRDLCEIVARNLPPERLQGAVADKHVTRVVVPTAEQRATIERIWAAGGDIVSVNPLRRSLEDMFLELTGPEERR